MVWILMVYHKDHMSRCECIIMRLETARLMIRDFVEEDAIDYHRTLGDPEVMGRIPGGPSPSVKFTLEKIRKYNAYMEKEGMTLWALEHKENGEIIGNCGLFHVEMKLEDVEVSYDIRPKYWNQGYATEAATAVLEYGLTSLGLDRIIAITFPDHKASMRVMEKAGMVYVGTGVYYEMEMVVYEKVR